MDARKRSPDSFAHQPHCAPRRSRVNQSRLTLIDWKRWTLIVTLQAGLKSANGVVITFGVAKGGKPFTEFGRPCAFAGLLTAEVSTIG